MHDRSTPAPTAHVPTALVSTMPAPTVPATDLGPVGAAVLVAREGRRLRAYRDSIGIWTIGIGHTSAAGPPRVGPGLAITAAECDAIFARDVAAYVAAVRRGLAVPVPQHAFDALVSVCYNIGPGAFLGSTVLRRLNAGDAAGARAAILMWDKPAAIRSRRRAEADQFATPYARGLPAPRHGAPPIRAVLPADRDPGAPTPAAAILPVEPAPARPPGWLSRLGAWIDAALAPRGA